MVAFVVVSHSAKLAEGVADICRMSAADVPVYPAGGLEDGSFGTDYARIGAAVQAALNPDGVILLVDMGSAVMTAEMVLEDLGVDSVRIADCPLVEGAILATVLSSAGADMAEILDELSHVAEQKKLTSENK